MKYTKENIIGLRIHSSAWGNCVFEIIRDEKTQGDFSLVLKDKNDHWTSTVIGARWESESYTLDGFTKLLGSKNWKLVESIPEFKTYEIY